MEFKHIFSLAKSLAKLAESEIEGKVITRNRIKQLVSNDHFGQLIMSKAPTIADKLKIIITSWFIINQPKIKPEDINRIISNLYVLNVEIYDEMRYKDETCEQCGGDGWEECSNCDGSGKDECRYCDGNGTEECHSCDGEGTEECRYCDGKGTETETEEDDEGDEVEVEVECVHCDGEGAERCRDCGGSGNFDCGTCEGTGYEECNSCDGSGSNNCDYCGGSGEVESDEYYYNVESVKYLVLGKSLEKYLGGPITKEMFDNIEYDDASFDYYMILKSSSYMSEDDVDETNRQNGMEESFVIIEDIEKLENTNIRIHGLS
jgi:hypothetical protein